MMDLSFVDLICVPAGDCTSENAPDNVRQWLQLITDENSLSSQDFLSTSDAYSCPDTSTVSQNTLHAQEEVESVVAAECSKDSARQHPATAAEDKNLTGSLDDNAQQFAVAHSVYHELALGNYTLFAGKIDRQNFGYNFDKFK